MIRVNEIFGPTIQGEGPMMGRVVGFLRLAECNLHCSWCDTKYTWDWDNYDRNVESVPMSLDAVADEMLAIGTEDFIVTGGEPMMQQRFLHELEMGTGLNLNVETNGTVIPTQEAIESIDLFSVSPKLAHSGDPESLRIKPKALSAYAELAQSHLAIFKWVARTVQDLDVVAEFAEQYAIPPECNWIMPEGATRAEHMLHLRTLADEIVSRKMNLSPRLHVLIWDDKRGV